MKYRVYYNREQDWPQVWSFDEGDQSTEVNVIAIHLNGCVVESSVNPSAPLNAPKAWFDVYASHLKLVAGVATFY